MQAETPVRYHMVICDSICCILATCVRTHEKAWVYTVQVIGQEELYQEIMHAAPGMELTIMAMPVRLAL